MKKTIAVVGRDGVLPDEVKQMAEKIGEDIASAGAVLICGGRGGVMEASCRGAKKHGGVTVGLLPSLDSSDANEYIDIALTTGLGYARNTLVASSADAVIAVNGSTGTLSEIAMALNFGKKVVAVKGSGGVADYLLNTQKQDTLLEKIVGADCSNAVSEALKK
jgi:uncharacterized protein (TIGR00725 family)